MYILFIYKFKIKININLKNKVYNKYFTKEFEFIY